MTTPPAAPPHLPLLTALADELARSGVAHAVLCPGSRNAPILLALDADPRIQCWSVVDERSAGFMALGIAKATGRPAAVCVTSGTAVSNLLPAATEAHEAGVPLLLLTADRPAELRDVGAGQTIDQLRIFDHVARWIVETDLGAATIERERWVRATACRAVAATRGPGRPGPVQLNIPLREPLTAAGAHPALTDGRPDGAPWLATIEAGAVAPQTLATLAGTLLGAQRGVLVAGRSERAPQLAALLPRLAQALGWPLLADPMSGARQGSSAIAAYDLALVASEAAELVPDVVLRIGDLPVSKPLRAWLATTAAAAHQLITTPEAVWADPDAVAGSWLQGDPTELVRGLITAIAAAREGLDDDRAGACSPEWLGRWRSLEQLALSDDGAVELESATPTTPLTEPLVARLLATALPKHSTLVVGASLPIRMLERWAPACPHPPRVLSNRGANGIDGVVSTAFGALAGGHHPGEGGHHHLTAGHRVVAYLGDLTLLYDQGGLAGASQLGLPLQVVVVNNDGGRIFERLPVARHAGEPFEALITTPHGLDLAHLAALHRIEHHRPTTVGGLTALLQLPADRPRLIEVRVGAAA